MNVTTDTPPNELRSTVRPIGERPRSRRGESSDPVHDRFGDDTLRLLSPILGLALPPDLPEFAELIEDHPNPSARPGGIRFSEFLKLVKWYCDAKGGEWQKFGEQIESAVG